MKQLRIVTLGDWNNYLSYFLIGSQEGAVRNGAWFRPVPLFGQDLKTVEAQIDFFKPHILLAHCIFNKAPHNPNHVFDLLRRVKKKGVMVIYHAGDARTEPRYEGDCSSFLSATLVNHGLLERFSKIMKVPAYYWPYQCFYQKGIADPDPRYAAKVAFTGALADDKGHVHSERSEFIRQLRKRIDIRVFPDKESGNTSFQTAELAATADCVLDVQMREDIPMYLSVRPFQYIGAGALLFHDDNDHINAIFEEGRHYVGYKKCDVNSFLEKYRYYVVDHPDKGRSIREEGFQYCQKYHSSEIRMRFVIDLYEGRQGRFHWLEKRVKVFEEAVLGDKAIELDGVTYPVIKGKHSMYVPEKKMKIVWSYNGKIESYVDWDKGRNAEAIKNHTFNAGEKGFGEDSLTSLASEYKMFEDLAAAGMAPPVSGFFYIKTMVSDSIYGVPHADAKGHYGFFIEDANKMGAPGKFTVDAFLKDFVEAGKIEASDYAVGDLRKSDNTINGYLIDVRRSLHDMMKLKDTSGLGDLRKKMEFHEDEKGIIARVQKKGCYPKNENSRPYQSYRLGGRSIEGLRDTAHRFDEMKIGDLTGKTLLDLGTNIGAMAAEAYRRGARQVTGLDIDGEYIACARDVARANGSQINYRRMDLNDTRPATDYLRAYYRKPIGVVFALSMYDQLSQNLWTILEALDWETCYVESHHAPEGLHTPHVIEMRQYLENQPGFRAEVVGLTTDRLPRYVWRLDRAPQEASAFRRAVTA